MEVLSPKEKKYLELVLLCQYKHRSADGVRRIMALTNHMKSGGPIDFDKVEEYIEKNVDATTIDRIKKNLQLIADIANSVDSIRCRKNLNFKKL